MRGSAVRRRGARAAEECRIRERMQGLREELGVVGRKGEGEDVEADTRMVQARVMTG